MDQQTISNNINNIMKYMKKNNVEIHKILKNIIMNRTNGKYIKDIMKYDFMALIDEIRWYLYHIVDSVDDINNDAIKDLKKNIENFLFINGFLYF